MRYTFSNNEYSDKFCLVSISLRRSFLRPVPSDSWWIDTVGQKCIPEICQRGEEVKILLASSSITSQRGCSGHCAMLWGLNLLLNVGRKPTVMLLTFSQRLLSFCNWLVIVTFIRYIFMSLNSNSVCSYITMLAFIHRIFFYQFVPPILHMEQNAHQRNWQ